VQLRVNVDGVRLICAAVVDAPAGTVTLGVNMANGIEQKGIDTLQQCIKKCAAAGLGIPATVSVAVKDCFSGSDNELCRVCVSAVVCVCVFVVSETNWFST